MNNWMNNNNNNWMGNQPITMPQRWNLPHYESPCINGRADANAFQMGPNSSIWLPDANDDIIWWIRTDNMGNKNVTPWAVSPYQEPKPVDFNALEARLANLEEQINAKQNKSNTKRPATVNAATTTTAE